MRSTTVQLRSPILRTAAALLRTLILTHTLARNPDLATLAQAAESPPAQPSLTDIRSEYLVDAWQTAEGEKGLPQNSVVSIAQTLDGYLWLGTFNGLVRFDGVRFVVFDAVNTPELASSRITFVYADRQGALWALSEFGDVARFANGRFTRFAAQEGLPPNGASVVGEDSNGDLWLGSARNHGTFRLENERFVMRLPPEPGDITVDGLIRSGDGTLWGNQGALVLQIKAGESERFHLTSDASQPLIARTGIEPPNAIIFRGSGRSRHGVWIASLDGLRKLVNGRWEKKLVSPYPLGSISKIYEDRSENLWLGTWRNGLAKFDAQGRFQHFRLTDSSAPESIRSILHDREGNLWVGTDGAGLYRIKPRTFRTYGTEDGLKTKVVKSVAQDRDGAIWVVNGGSVTRFPNQQPSTVKPFNLEINGAWCSLFDRDGTGWFGTYGDGLVRYRDGQRFAYTATSRAVGVILALFQDRNGTVWAGRADALTQVDGDHLRKIDPPPFVKNMDVRALAEDRRGNLYVGLNGEGLLVRTNGQWVHVSRKDGLSDQHVWSLYCDQDDTIWIGTYGNGLNRLKDGKVYSFSNSQTRLPGIITGIVEDDRGRLWLGSNRGVGRVDRQQLNEFADGNRTGIDLMNYGTADGLATPECASGLQPTVWKARDGRLWFATVAGVSVVDPNHLPTNSVSPPVVIEEVLLDEKVIGETSPVAVDRSRQPGLNASIATPVPPQLRIPPGKHRLEIHFTALSFTAPEQVRFKYRLERWDHDWIEAGNRRVAYFSSVDPGDYRFRVIACNNDGVWNEAGAALGVVMLPFFWQTGWFRVVAGTLLVGGVAGVARYVSLRKVREELERLQRQAAVNQERTRIARDMHDDLGANLTQISFLSEMAGREGQNPDRVKHDLRELSGLAQEVVRHLDELVWVVNPDHDQTGSFVDYLGAYAEDCLRVQGITCRFDVPSDLVRLSVDSNTRHQFFLAFKEVLNNVLKHAAATQVTIQVRIEDQVLRVNVMDNGCGFDPAGTAAFSNGLVNLRNRLEALAGSCTFQSTPGQGTRVQLSLPVGAVPFGSNGSHTTSSK